MAPRSSIEGRMLLLKRRYFWLICGLVSQMLLNSAVSGQSHCFLPPNKSFNREFKQRTSRFWEFEEKTNTWVEIRLPFDLTACTNGTCTKVGSIENLWKKRSPPAAEQHQQKEAEVDSGDKELLPIRKRVSLTRMSEASIWVTGQSGSIYERFWNGVRWVIAPHELPASAGTAVSVFIVNQTILSLSEAGILYLLQLNENSQPIWSDLVLNIEPRIESAEAEAEASTTMVIKTGAVSHDGERLLLTTAYGSLLEISEFQPLRWENHGRPPGGDVSVLADTGSLKTSAVFTISSSGDLYEFDKKTKPSWKKHIWSEASSEAVLLSPSTGCTLHGLVGHNSLSLFLLTQDGYLLERRLHRRKWKWMIHEVPKGHQLSSLTIVKQNQISEKELSMFFTTRNGLVFEYQLPKLTGVSRKDQIKGVWVNHKHPQHAKVARGISGVQLQLGRLVFPLDDGRIAELHFSGIGGEAASPTHQINVRKKTLYTFDWSILEAPESEGWNAEYCTNDRGPLNCIAGMMDVVADDESNDLGIIAPGRRLKAPANQHYLFLPNHESSSSRSNQIMLKQ
ncbi:hypothetical protein HPP92_028181 [Vanilla planifolia]|uniref:Uncharacterized protein n=1 Tax=Vanilla planifolia TaxID=51239 RepID=A0A835P9P0_VANPL|nr:hypothetical protein HPP92_028181 [Vanilla planifolia]